MDGQILQHSNIKILSDVIYLDITAPDEGAIVRLEKEDQAKPENCEKPKADNAVKKRSPLHSTVALSFAAGVGVGIGLMTILVSRP
eukprot:scaffold7212_cov165-Cylindrotheca_fusiformis.AAC.4